MTAYLQSQGLTVVQVTPSRLFVQATGTVRQMEQAFHVRINDYEVAGRTVYSNDRDPSVPVSLRGVVRSVMGLTSLGSLQSSVQPATEGPRYGYSPAQIATAYNFPNRNNRLRGETIYTGSDVTLAIATIFSFADTDVQGFWRSFGIVRQGSVTRVPVNGGSDRPYGETTLDVQQAGAQAPGADILVYMAPENTFANSVLVFDQIVNDDLASVVSSSWGKCEPDFPPSHRDALRAIFLQGVAQGMTFFSGSGDRGAVGVLRRAHGAARVADTP